MKVVQLDLVSALLDLVRQAAREGAAQALGTHCSRESPDPGAGASVLLDKRALAHALGVSTATVDRLCRANRIPFVRVRDARRFDLAAVREALAVPPRQPSPSRLALAPPTPCTA
jgi:excisionase family DNA binding protein